ncbi:uncharacterized protein LOC134958851 [Pseudophryne corroboree]|uniref:uncharacterized protein LOC134958851 n=1 Tax=Pseudophryne corroboree TaxID=495146 RepID=UPI00308151E2
MEKRQVRMRWRSDRSGGDGEATGQEEMEKRQVRRRWRSYRSGGDGEATGQEEMEKLQVRKMRWRSYRSGGGEIQVTGQDEMEKLQVRRRWRSYRSGGDGEATGQEDEVEKLQVRRRRNTSDRSGGGDMQASGREEKICKRQVRMRWRSDSGGHPAAYGAMGQPYQPNYLMTPDIERKHLIPGYMNEPEGKMASAAMNPSMSPPYYPPAAATSPAMGTDGPTAPLPEWTDIPGYEGMGTYEGAFSNICLRSSCNNRKCLSAITPQDNDLVSKWCVYGHDLMQEFVDTAKSMFWKYCNFINDDEGGLTQCQIKVYIGLELRFRKGLLCAVAVAGGKFLPPPDVGPIPGAVPTPTNANWTVPFISEDVAREALLDYANSKCCYRSTAAQEMNFQELQPFNTYRYRLETFTESRACAWVTTPYTGQPVDSSAYGPAPHPWKIPVQVSSMFQDKEMKMPVPRTSSVKACPQCLGTCKTVCTKCHGTRRVTCWLCHGGSMDDSCHLCGGRGTRSCTTCQGSGHVTCARCSGRGKLLNYIEMTVTWKNNIYEFVADHNSKFSTELFTKVNGEKIFTDEQLLLAPLNNFPSPAINQASLNGLQQHQAQCAPSSRILRQRHGTEWLPLTKVVYIWKDNRYDYFVYGKENKVQTDNYPQKCCCAVIATLRHMSGYCNLPFLPPPCDGEGTRPLDLRIMELRNTPVTPSSPARVSIAVMTSPVSFDLVDIDLDPPRDPPVATSSALGPPADLGMCLSDLTPGSHVRPRAALPSVNAKRTPTVQLTRLMGDNPSGVHGNTEMVQSSNPSAGINTGLSSTYLPSSSNAGSLRSQSDVQTESTQNVRRGQMRCISVLPPSYLAVASAGEPCPASVDIGKALITEADAQRALRGYGDSNCCYSSAPAKQMSLQELQPFNVYKYCLETFTESRACELVTEHYTGQLVDSSPNTSSPQPWDIPVAVPNMFKDGMQKMVVPHTFSVKPCPRCKGLGRNMCLKCHGSGRVQCLWCNGTGRRMQMDMCHACFGSGTESCRMCDPSRVQDCVPCAGKGQVVTYTQMTIIWKNNIFEFISENHSEFSNDLFKDVKGEKIFTEEQLSVSPLTNFPDWTLIQVSQNALEQHQTQFSTSCRILRQRQSVELLPLTKVHYTWKENQFSYFVYGKENKVYIQNYPQKCCCVVM